VVTERIQITIGRNELQLLVRIYKNRRSEMKGGSLKEIRQIFPSAISLFEEVGDVELQELIRRIESVTEMDLD